MNSGESFSLIKTGKHCKGFLFFSKKSDKILQNANNERNFKPIINCRQRRSLRSSFGFIGSLLWKSFGCTMEIFANYSLELMFTKNASLIEQEC